ncbi:MAG TPA: hypothetical protein VLZ06_11575 [Solirubrobacteraceae bacterium]|nr:hypothetical protein [Solirubrobacteraceae bacterium]
MSKRPHRQQSFATPAGVLVACLLALSACGSERAGNGIASQSATRALARVESAAADAATVHVEGAVAGPARALAIDMELERGQGGRGTIALGGLRARLVQDAGWLYVKANPALLRRFVGAAAARRLAGRWLKGPADHGPFASLASLTDLRTLLRETLSSHRGPTTAGTGRVGGRPAVALRDTITGATLYASATGTPYPLALRRPGRDGGTLRFDRWNRAVSLEAPPNPLNIKAVFALKGL